MEPKCDFCNAYDKNRCRTLMQAHECQSFRDYIDSAEDEDYEDSDQPVAGGAAYQDGRRPGFAVWALRLATTVAERSRDPSTKVGAVIIRPDKSICSMGYNGFPRGMDDRDEWYAERSEKYDRVIHAEANAILQAKQSVEGCDLFVTHPCCKECAKLAAAAGIRSVTWYTDAGIRERFNTDRSKEILRDSGVIVREIESGREEPTRDSGQGAEASACQACGE